MMTVQSLLPGTTYTFFVRGIHGGATGAWDSVTITTRERPPPQPE